MTGFSCPPEGLNICGREKGEAFRVRTNKLFEISSSKCKVEISKFIKHEFMGIRRQLRVNKKFENNNKEKLSLRFLVQFCV